MFNWFKKIVIKWVRDDWENAQKRPIDEAVPSGKSIGISRRLEQRGMNFTIYQANGGYVMEYSKYDERTDRHNNTLHIITSDQDLGQGIAQIITLEMLRS